MAGSGEPPAKKLKIGEGTAAPAPMSARGGGFSLLSQMQSIENQAAIMQREREYAFLFSHLLFQAS